MLMLEAVFYHFLEMNNNLPPMPKAPPGFILISLSLCNKKTRKFTLSHTNDHVIGLC